MPTRAPPFLVLLAVAFLLLVSSLFTVAQTELAIRSRFGEILQAEYKPGLHLRVPFVDTVRKFERRIITQNFPSESFLTSEGKILNVDFYVKWRITDVGAFYRSTGGIEDNAARRAFRGDHQELVAPDMLEILLDLHRVPAGGKIAGVGGERRLDRVVLTSTTDLVEVTGAEPLNRVPNQVDETDLGEELGDPFGHAREQRELAVVR